MPGTVLETSGSPKASECFRLQHHAHHTPLKLVPGDADSGPLSASLTHCTERQMPTPQLVGHKGGIIFKSLLSGSDMEIAREELITTPAAL